MSGACLASTAAAADAGLAGVGGEPGALADAGVPPSGFGLPVLRAQALDAAEAGGGGGGGGGNSSCRTAVRAVRSWRAASAAAASAACCTLLLTAAIAATTSGPDCGMCLRSRDCGCQ